jgi:glycosyltransferase involved in cell wall biosynthesis
VTSVSNTTRCHRHVSEVGSSVLLAAFDAFPGLKGAQAHIRANLKALRSTAGQINLICLGSGGTFQDPDSGASVHTFSTTESNFLRRCEHFAGHVRKTADRIMAVNPPSIIHFRDIWSGMPLLSHPISRTTRTIFEVNGLPSVELVHHYPELSDNPDFLSRLRWMEQNCLAKVDHIITVSNRTAAFLQERGAAAKKISIIPNTAHPHSSVVPQCPVFSALESGEEYATKILLYTGTMADWQGIVTLLRAMVHLRHRKDIFLVIAASGKKGTTRVRYHLNKLLLTSKVALMSGIEHHLMPALFATSYLSLAPLARGARNELQGCCPLKIVESMASDTPVIASDLPVVRELVRHGEDGWLVPPDSPRALAGAISLLLDNPSLRDRLATAARTTAERNFGPDQFSGRLNDLYRNLGVKNE